MQEWDGNDYQTWARFGFTIVGIGLAIDHFRYDGTHEFFGFIAIFYILLIFMIPEGPKSPPR